MNPTNERARQMVKQLESVGELCGYLLAGNQVVLRRPGSPYTDEPTNFDESTLSAALSEGLLIKQTIMGNPGWEWYALPQRTA